MTTLKSRIALLIITLIFARSASQAQTALKLCDLLSNPEHFNGQQVKVRATLRYGFEWQEFYCLDCLDKGKAWLELPDNLDRRSSRVLKRMPEGAGIVNLTVVGSFHFGKSYGHLNGYRYQRTAEGVRSIPVLQKGMKDAAIEKKVEEQCACGGTNPK